MKKWLLILLIFVGGCATDRVLWHDPVGIEADQDSVPYGSIVRDKCP